MIQRKYIVITLVAISILSVLYFLFSTYPKIGKIPVEILVYPEDAKVYTDDITTGNTVYLKSGEHTFKAQKDGWVTDETTVTISDTLKTIALLPSPESTEAKELANSAEGSSKREELAGIAANTRGLDIRSSYSILNKLPYSDISGPFKIDYGFNQDDKKTPYIIVSYSTPNGRRKAIRWLQDNGTNLTMTEIVFEDFINPTHKEKDAHEE